MLYRIELLIAYVLYCTGIYWLYRRRLRREGANIVLVYHRVLPGRRRIGEMVGEQEFDWQMSCLARDALPVTWRDMTAGSERGGIRVLVTFDDGYRDNFTLALPILEKYRVPAIFFVVTRFVFGNERIELDEAAADDDIFPTAAELDRAARSSVVTFGNHTDSHRLVASLDADAIGAELRSSQRQFTEKWGKAPETFAYPRGRAEDIVECGSMLHQNGISAAFTMLPGRIDLEADDRYRLPRIGVSHVNDRVLFKVKSIGMIVPFINLRNYLANRVHDFTRT